MFVIRLPNGNLQVPQTAIHTGDGRLIGDVYVEIGPEDTDYARLAEQALTPDEVEERKAPVARGRRRAAAGVPGVRQARRRRSVLAGPANPTVTPNERSGGRA